MFPSAALRSFLSHVGHRTLLMDKATAVRKTTSRDPAPVYVSGFSSSTNIWEQTSHSVPRRRVLPPEIVHIIVEIIGKDRETLSACALAAREFSFAALCCLGRHIAVNSVPRLRECANLITNDSAFQHVRSLDLGITTKKVLHERDWSNYLVILESFARRRTLTRLWLSEVPFYFSKRRNEGAVANVIASLTTTVNELGLYSCRFSSYGEMISLIRAFPLCTSLYVRDCVTKKTSKDDIFAKLPQHTPSISNLELTASSGHRFLIGLSTLIKDAALDISSLTDFLCDMTTTDAVHHTMVTAVAPPIERLQLVCDEAQGFHGTPMLSKNAHVFPSPFSSKSWQTRRSQHGHSSG